MFLKVNRHKVIIQYMIVVIVAALIITAVPLHADAATSSVRTLKEGQTISSALTGTAKHKIQFVNESLANAPQHISHKFTVYIDGIVKLFYYGGDADYGKLTLLKVNSKTTLLFVTITTEDEFPVADKIYRYSGGKLIEVGDLNKLTKSTYIKTSFISNELELGQAKNNKKGAYLPNWTRFPKIKSAGKNKFTVNWCSIENSVGMYYVNIPYTYKDKKVKRTSTTTFATKFKSPWKKNWGTVNKTIQTYTKPGGETESFLAKKTAKLKITKVKLLKGSRYFKAEVKNGKFGWFKGTKGGFKEAQFAA